MKRIVLYAFIALLSISCSKSPDEKARLAIEDYFESMGYPCEVMSAKWCGNVNCSNFDPQYQRRVKKSDTDWASEKEENKKLHDEISKEMAKL